MWTPPKTWAVGEVLTAADLNEQLRDNMSALDPTPAIALPGSPTDGQHALLVDSLTAPTFAWRFIYCAGISDANKWLFVGGSPIVVEAGGGTLSSASYGDWSSNASITVPVAGDYVVKVGGAIYGTQSSVSIYLAPKLGSASAADSDAATLQNGNINGVISVQRTIEALGLAASAVVKTQGRATSGSIVAQYLYLEVLPVRCA